MNVESPNGSRKGSVPGGGHDSIDKVFTKVDAED